MEAILIILMAAVMEFIDAGLGMGYGTVLSPLLIIMGYDPIVIVPAVLLSQAMGGFTASMFHHKLKNVDFTYGKKDLKVVLLITVLGIFATVIGAMVGINISKVFMKNYIGVLVLIVGAVMLLRSEFSFSWWKMVVVGTISSFNKGLSGGGFGPIVTGGQIIAGNESKASIGCTTFAEAPICIASFITYALIRGIEGWDIVLFMCIGSMIGSPIGAMLTKKMDSKLLRTLLGMLIFALGFWVLTGGKA